MVLIITISHRCPALSDFLCLWLSDPLLGFYLFFFFYVFGLSNGHHLKCGFIGDWDKRQGESNYQFILFFLFCFIFFFL